MQRKMNLFATQRLVELLSNIDHQISRTLTESIRYRNSFQVSYLDFGSTNDTISFLARNKYDDIQKSNPHQWNSMVWKDKRAEMKIGKLIRMFYGDSFPTNHPKGTPRPKPLMDIESFVNKFKAEMDKDVNYERFEIISGKDFHFWYSQSNYSRFVHEETTLGRSCLRYEESSKFLKMYSMNPDTFRMIILKDDEGKLRGRANLWTLEKPEGRIYMDRIYSVNDFDVELFKDYAKQQGWLHKEAQTYGFHNNIVDTTNGEIYQWDKLTLKSKIKKIPGTHYKYYPYMDTLSIFNTEEYTLTNDGRLRVLKPHILLTDYQGQYNSEVDGRERVFSTAYNEYIIRDESQFVEIDDTWVYQNDAVYVHNSGGLHAYRNSDKVVESYIYKRKWFLKSATEFSEYLGTYIHEGSVRTAFIDDDMKEEVKIHYKMVGREFEEKGGVILKKKINPNPKQSTKRSIGDKYNFEEMLQRISDGRTTTSRSTRSRRESIDEILRSNNLGESPWSVLMESDQTPSGNTHAVTDDTEEDSDPFAGVDMDQYTDEVRDYLYERLGRDLENRVERRNRPAGSLDEPSFYADILTGRPQPRRRQSGVSLGTTVQRGRPVIDEPILQGRPVERIRFTPSDDLVDDAISNAEDGQPREEQPRPYRPAGTEWWSNVPGTRNVRSNEVREEPIVEEPTVEDTSGDVMEEQPTVEETNGNDTNGTTIDIETTNDGGNGTTYMNFGTGTSYQSLYMDTWSTSAQNDRQRQREEQRQREDRQQREELNDAIRRSRLNMGVPSRFLRGDDDSLFTDSEGDDS